MIITIVCLTLIVVAFIGVLIYTIQLKKKGDFDKNRRVIDSLPSAISTLGVIGTFLGITIGLWNFDTNPGKIDASIATLLQGLKTAFYTSLAGMFFSLILRFIFDKMFEKEDVGSPAEQTADAVCSEMRNMSSQLIAAIQTIATNQTSANRIFAQIQQQSEETVSNTSSLLEVEKNNSHILSEQSQELQNHSILISEKVAEVEQKMSETNDLLTTKFDEFSQLLKKSNTEALVEVMKKVTEEFQKQMNGLISKLVQENFDQLNDSVKQMIVWQHENKEMISKLTEQYKQMNEEFASTSNLLKKVGDDTRNLVGSGGTLSVLIEQLKQVMIDDKKFIEISTKLEQSASLTQKSIILFNQSNQALDGWIKKHQSFLEKIENLIAKLDELDKMRDYTETFWEETKKGMNDGVAIIKQGAKSLNDQLADLDKLFYERLSTTLSELDVCIQAMIEQK